MSKKLNTSQKGSTADTQNNIMAVLKILSKKTIPNMVPCITAMLG
jgi:hypothetical protein